MESDEHSWVGLLPLFNNVIEHLHHGCSLLLGETFALEALDKLERVKVMIALS